MAVPSKFDYSGFITEYGYISRLIKESCKTIRKDVSKNGIIPFHFPSPKKENYEILAQNGS
jgi:hypothetical protein